MTTEPLLDHELDRLREWMDGQGLGHGDLVDVEQLTGGTQNIMVRFSRAGDRYVLRRGPRHLRPKTNDALRQEMTVLAALADTDVPHPRLLGACPDDDVLDGAVFFLMESIDGFNPGAGEAPDNWDDPAMWHAASLDIVDSIAKLGAVDHLAVGLGDVGRPDGFVDRQVSRWMQELAGYDRNEGYPGPELPGLDVVAAYLDDNLPTTSTAGIMHGDYHLSNLMLQRNVPAMAAIVDWEMATVGDPLVDVGWLLATWPEIDTGIPIGPKGAGLAGREELVARYAEQTTRDLSDLLWYEVLANFKLGIVLEGTHARACAGRAPKAIGDMLHAAALSLIAGGHELVKRHT